MSRDGEGGFGSGDELFYGGGVIARCLSGCDVAKVKQRGVVQGYVGQGWVCLCCVVRVIYILGAHKKNARLKFHA